MILLILWLNVIMCFIFKFCQFLNRLRWLGYKMSTHTNFGSLNPFWWLGFASWTGNFSLEIRQQWLFVLIHINLNHVLFRVHVCFYVTLFSIIKKLILGAFDRFSTKISFSERICFRRKQNVGFFCEKVLRVVLKPY